MTRQLSPSFLNDLKMGLLAPILHRVKSDSTLCLEIRDEAINIYYRGGSLLRLGGPVGRYRAVFDANYFGSSRMPATPLPSVVCAPRDVTAWLDALPVLKQAVDLYDGKSAEEREVQQRIVWENNRSSIARATDYYICDMEYSIDRDHRFDLIAVRWPSSSAQRKKTNGHRLVIGEVKFGDQALTGSSGLHAHIADVDRYLAVPGNVNALKSEMVQVFNQKHELGLINCKKELGSFSDEPPLLLLLLVNHDPGSKRLRDLIRSRPSCPHVELRIVAASLLGLGLFDAVMLKPEDVLKHPCP